MNSEDHFGHHIYSVLDSIPVSIYWKDKEGKYLGCNKYMLEMTGIKNRSDIIGKTDYDLVWKDIAVDLQQIDNIVMKNRGKYEVEETPLLVNQQKRTYLSTKTPLYDSEKEVIGIIGISIDITDRKNAEKWQQEKKISEKAANIMELLSGFVAHELRTPLTSINIYLDLLQADFYSKLLDEKLNKKDKEKIFHKNFDICKNTVKVAAQIIDNILVNLKNVALGKIKTSHFRIIHITKSIKKAIKEYPYQDSEQQLIHFIDSGGFSYLGDEQLTKHMIYNLIKNSLRAIKEASKGDITLKLVAKEGFNQLIFTDTALGLSESDTHKVFDRFETKDIKGTGAGLGLAFCKLVMDSYGGYIECRSELGKYTSFILNFPKPALSNPKPNF
jgi:two-component system, OmpR family, aerobic respiration control sensor histidine kinase ArcB